MKFKFLTAFALAVFYFSAAHAAPLTEVTLSELRTIAASGGPVVVELFDSTSTSAECLKQPPVAEKVAAHYSGRVRFVRLDISKAPDFAATARAFCPTHLFIDHNQPEPNRIAQRNWGFLSEAQFQELILEYFAVKP